MGTYMSRWGGTPMPGQDPNLIRTVDQCTTGVAPGQPCEHGIANITFRSPNWGTHWTTVYNYRGSASYVHELRTTSRLDTRARTSATTRPTTATISS